MTSGPPAAEPLLLEVRRSRPNAALQFGTAAGLLVLALGSLVHAYGIGAPMSRDGVAAAGFFIAIMGFYVWRSAKQLRDRPAFLRIGPDGLHVPTILDGAIPWSRVQRVQAWAGFRKGRLDITVDAEVYATLRFGLRILGDPVVRQPKGGTEFSILLSGSDHRSPEVYAAIRRYWSPPPPGRDP